MSTKTPFKNLYVTGIFNLVGNATVNGNVNITGNIILGNTIISEQKYNELLFLANNPPVVAGPKGDDGIQGPPGPAGVSGELNLNENNDIIESNIGTGSKGDTAFGIDSGNYYFYVCYRSGNWGRIQLDINF